MQAGAHGIQMKNAFGLGLSVGWEWIFNQGPALSAGGQEGYADRVGLDGLEACPGSSRSRRPRNAASNPHRHARFDIGTDKWTIRFILTVLGSRYRVSTSLRRSAKAFVGS